MIPQYLDITTLLLIGVVAVLGHAALIIVSRWLNPMMVLMAVFIILTLLGIAEIPGQTAAKWGRVYITLLLMLVGVLYSKHYRIGPIFGLYLLFAILYMLAAVWSDRMVSAFMFKGLYLILVVGGGFTAYSVRSEWDLRKGLRLFVVTGGLIAIIMLTDFVRNPAAISSVGRFEPWGIVATRVGAIGGPLGVICAFVALYDRVKIWKIIGYCAGGALALCIVYSGSRGGLFMAGVGCFVIGLPVIKRPVLAASVLVSALLIFMVVSDLASAANSEATERLMEINFDSRAEKWADSRSQFTENPIFGVGWVYETKNRESGSTANMHSIYFQVAVEMGAFGLLVFGSVLAMIGARAMWVLRKARRYRSHVEVTYLGLGIITCILAFGIVESGVLMGGTIVAMLLPFGFGLLDRISELLDEEAAQYGFDADYYDEAWDDDGGSPDEGWSHDHNQDRGDDGDGDDYAEVNDYDADDHDEAREARTIASEDIVDGH